MITVARQRAEGTGLPVTFHVGDAMQLDLPTASFDAVRSERLLIHVPDPAAVRGSTEQVEKAFRDAFFLLDRRISLFLSLPISTLDRFSLKQEVDSIGQQ